MGSLAAACDSIVRIDVDELTGVRSTATLVKARDPAPPGMQLRFELEQVILEERDSFGDPRSTIVVRSTNQPVAWLWLHQDAASRSCSGAGVSAPDGRAELDEATLAEGGPWIPGMRDQLARDALKGLQ